MYNAIEGSLTVGKRSICDYFVYVCIGLDCSIRQEGSFGPLYFWWRNRLKRPKQRTTWPFAESTTIVTKLDCTSTTFHSGADLSHMHLSINDVPSNSCTELFQNMTRDARTWRNPTWTCRVMLFCTEPPFRVADFREGGLNCSTSAGTFGVRSELMTKLGWEKL